MSNDSSLREQLEAAIAERLDGDYFPAAPAIAKSVMRTPALLEALDTIDRLEGDLCALAGADPGLFLKVIRARQVLNGGTDD